MKIQQRNWQLKSYYSLIYLKKEMLRHNFIIDTKASVIKQPNAPAVISSITTKTTTSTSRYLTDFEN